MSENNNIKRFTAADIEKYHKGLLSAQEKHALEKAALEDPFLADALEGYTTAGVYIADDMQELKERLSERIEKGKVIAMPAVHRQRFALWKVAAIIILVAGAGFLVYQFGFNNKQKNIAQGETKNTEETKDSNQILSAPQKTDETIISNETASKPINTEKTKQDNLTTRKVILGSGRSKADSVYITSNLTTNPSTSVPEPIKNGNVAVNNKEVKQDAILSNENLKAKAIDNKKAEEKITLAKKPDADAVKDQDAGYYKANQGIVVNRRADNNQFRGNIFRGRVMDANNNPVPFANITNIIDSVGTYADARGNFNFVSTDTVLNVEVRSVGFNNINTQLKNRVADNEVVLQEDRSMTARVLLDTAKSNAIKRSREAKATVEEEAEPEDSWGLYDTYIVNNLRVPENFKTKPIKGEVEVSFEVDKNGEPTNIKITKSLCDACDKEAIRLIKEGPKWKKKAKKGRATVTVSF